MELEEAWLRGILPIPEYIVALYNAPSELEKLAKSITTVRDEAAKKRFQKKYEKLRRALTEAGGVRESIAAYLKKADAKVIVFCPRVAKLREFMLLRREWFGAVNGAEAMDIKERTAKSYISYMKTNGMLNQDSSNNYQP